MKQKLSTLSILFVLPPLALWLMFNAQFVPVVQASTIVYVNQAVVGGNNNGTSWADAYSDLQTALTASLPDSDDELWVAAGLYKPTSDTNREATFQLKSGVALYGGFAGTETERDQRDWTVNLTVLSGDIDNNDITTPAGVVTDTGNIVGENSYHVVTGSGVTVTAVLDGFVLTAGNANGDYFPDCIQQCGGGLINLIGDPSLTNVNFSGNGAISMGGGLYNSGSNLTLTNVIFRGNYANGGGGLSNSGGSPNLTNVTFSDNRAAGGGGMYNFDSSASLINVTFSGNSAEFYGGGMNNYNYHNNSPSLTSVTFSGNSATNEGGGMYNYASSPSLVNVTFSGNSTEYFGGGLSNYYYSNPSLTNVIFTNNYAWNGGGMHNTDSSPSLSDVTFSDNSANGGGGGMYNYDSNPNLTNVTFSGNWAYYHGGGMGNGGTSSPSLVNVTFSSNSANLSGGGIHNLGDTVLVSSSIIANNLGGGDCAGDPITSAGYNIDSDGSCNLTAVGDMPNTDPLLDPLADNGGYTLTHMPRADSPAIDAGDPLNCPPTDQRGMPRPNDGDGDGNAVCDIGSVEYYVPSPLSGVAIQGPIIGSVQAEYTFTAVITPITATQPITYVWQTAGQTPVTHTGGITDTAVFSWNTPGAHVLTVTASNSVSSVTASINLTILESQYHVYLPIANKP